VPYKAIQEQWDFVGGLSTPSKMPCLSYGISAQKCITGNKLRHKPNTPCAICYAFRGQYNRPNVKKAHSRRLENIDATLWPHAMSDILNYYLDKRGPEKYGYFRWFDSGDLQNTAQLLAIEQVAVQTPKIKHWLPTHEYPILAHRDKKWNEFLSKPDNLVVRPSAVYIDQDLPAWRKKGYPISTVTRDKDPIGFACPAREQDNKCGDCRACWEPEKYPIISYWEH
jgi:hypothetical protein